MADPPTARRPVGVTSPNAGSQSAVTGYGQLKLAARSGRCLTTMPERAHNEMVISDGFRVVMMRIWRVVIALALMAGATTGGPAIAATGGATTAGTVTGTGSGSTGACVDTPLTITFGSAPTLGTTGSITVHNADGSVADRIDLADPASFTETVGGATDEAGNPHSFSYYPVIITGDTATIYLHHELAYGRAYYVTADPTVFTAAGFTGVADPHAWRFITTRRHPRPDARIITVDSRGRGEFCTVQGAINAIPANNAVPRTIKVADGTYTELDWVAPDKPLITVAGQSRSGTVIQYANNNALNSANTTDVCARQAIPVHDDFNCWRSNFSVEANDFTLRNLTLLAAQWSDPAFVLGGWVPPTVNAAVNAGTAGTTVDVDWSAPAGHSAADVIALCAVRARRCRSAQRVGTAASIGTASFRSPAGHGAYQVRYYARGLVTAVSASLSFGPVLPGEGRRPARVSLGGRRRGGHVPQGHRPDLHAATVPG